MSFKKKTNLAFKSTIILTALSLIALIFSFRWCFNSADGYFVKSAPPIIFSIIYLSGIIASLVATFFIDKSQIIKTNNEIGKMQVPYIIAATLLAISVLVCNLLSDDSFLLAAGIGVGAFTIYAMICSAKNGYNKGTIKILLVYLSVIFPVSVLLGNDTNYLRHINSVENTLTTVFAISFMSYILYEAKRIYEGAHSRWHFGTMLLTVHTGIALSIPYIVAYLTKSVDEPQRFLQMIPILLISLFVGFELIRFVREAEAHTQDKWSTFKNLDNETLTEETIEE